MKKILSICFVLFYIIGCDGNQEDIIKISEYSSSTLKQDSVMLYYYDTLSDENKNLYDCIYDSIKSYTSEVIFDYEDFEINNGYDSLSEVIEYITYDHPELYYFLDCSLFTSESKETYKLEFNYIYTLEEVTEYDEQLEEVVSTFKEQIPVDASEIEIAEIAYEYVITTTSYDEASEYNQTVISSLINNVSVCAGYARAYQYLLEQVGIKAVYLPVDAQEDSETQTAHAINMISINDDYYYVDCTWGDITDNYEHACSAYLFLSSQDMLQLYYPQYTYKETSEELFKYNSYDENDIYELISNALLEGDRFIELKFDTSVYAYAYNKLITNEGIFRILSQLGIETTKIDYIEKKEIGFIEIHF